MLRRLGSRLIASYVAVVLLALLLSSLALLVLGIQYKREETYSRLGTSLYFILPQLQNAGPPVSPRALRDAIRERIRPQLEATNFRLLLLGPGGQVAIDSRMAAPGTNIERIEVSETRAIPGREVYTGSTRDASDREWLYVAAPPRELARPGSDLPGDAPAREPVFAYLVLMQPAPGAGEVLNDLARPLLLGAALGLAFASLLGWLLARSITRPLANLGSAARRVAAGNFDQQVPLEGSGELVALAEHFNTMAAEVERARRVQHDFLANVSHDLKTPLTSIQGFSQAMLDGAVREPQEYAAAARVINDEALRMGRLVSDLLDLTRIRSGEISIEKQQIDVAELLRETAGGMQPQAAERHVELRVEVGTLPPAMADADRLRRAVANLIDNALRHTPPEGRVTLRGDVAPGALLISVRDTGEGIPAEDLPRIFERFYQVDKSRAAKGGSSGLGLAIVQEIVAAHDGQLAVQSQAGVGTEFRITLPLDGSSRIAG